jgi:hypothetical protein
VFKTTLCVLALSVAGLAAGNAYAATTSKVVLVKSAIMKLPVKTTVAPRIKLVPGSKLGCNEISRTIIFNGQAYTATKCR